VHGVWAQATWRGRGLVLSSRSACSSCSANGGSYGGSTCASIGCGAPPLQELLAEVLQRHVQHHGRDGRPAPRRPAGRIDVCGGARRRAGVAGANGAAGGAGGAAGSHACFGCAQKMRLCARARARRAPRCARRGALGYWLPRESSGGARGAPAAARRGENSSALG
jgi:hypothetical protein